MGNNNNNNNNNNKLQLGCHPVAVVILHVYKNMKLVTNKFKSGGLHENFIFTFTFTDTLFLSVFV